jgi:GNAT superfamily N-acetyltransferase
MTDARLDRGGLKAAFEAALRVPCIREKMAAVSFERFDRSLADAKVLSFYRDGEPIGAAVFVLGQFHIAIDERYHGRWATRKVIDAIEREWGRSPVALVDQRNAKAMRFAERLGFEKKSQDGNMVRFE